MNSRCKRLLTWCCWLFAQPSVFGGGEVTSVRLQSVDGIPVIEARLAMSDPLAFVVDTGSSRMLVDSAVARRLGLPEGEPDSVSGAGAGRIAIRWVGEVSLTIGESKPERYEFAAIDLAGVSSLLGRKIDGIIGYGLFSRFIVTIDYDQERITIGAVNDSAIRETEAVPIEIKNRWAFVEARLLVAGAEPITDRFLIDSGSADAVDHPILADANVRKSATNVGNGLGESVRGFVGTADALQIGPYVLRNLSIASGGGNPAASKLIGSAVLSRFTITYDYPHARIWLVPRAGAALEKR